MEALDELPFFIFLVQEHSSLASPTGEDTIEKGGECAIREGLDV